MKILRSGHGCKMIVTVVALMYSIQVLAHNDVLSVYPGAKVFNKEYKVHRLYQMIESDIRYVSDFTGETEEGYAPHKMAGLEGEFHATVYDHTTADSAIAINKSMVAELERKKFEIIYSCSTSACGDVAGWKLFLSHHVDGDVENQFYTLARHPLKRGGNWFVAFYVNEFSGIPRSIVHTLEVSDTTFNKYSIDSRQLAVKTDSDENALAQVYFSFDSAEITPSSQASLRKLAAEMNDDPSLTLSMVGYTDRAGPATYNQTLSRERALAVQRFFTAQGVALERLQADGAGEVVTSGTGEGSNIRSKDRRVDIVSVGDGGR